MISLLICYPNPNVMSRKHPAVFFVPSSHPHRSWKLSRRKHPHGNIRIVLLLVRVSPRPFLDECQHFQRSVLAVDLSFQSRFDTVEFMSGIFHTKFL